jgi:hypothetical protein
MNWDLMNGTEGGGLLAYVLGFAVIMLVGWLLTRRRH